ncbi:MAG: GC-type dockerin domain-anchored protein [Phycisphaerales bacterium JB064]
MHAHMHTTAIASNIARGTAGVFASRGIGLAAMAIVAGWAQPALAQWTVTDLHPGPEYAVSFAYGIADGVVVGVVGEDVAETFACMWTDVSAGSFVPLHAGDGTTRALASSGGAGGVQVGERRLDFYDFRATLWRGDAGSAVELHPAGAGYSSIACTDGARHGGLVDASAVLWTGDTGAYTVLHSGRGMGSFVLAIHGEYQAGAAGDGRGHAALWQGTPESMVDLHPGGADHSLVRSIYTDGAGPGEQGGELNPTFSSSKAALWHGTAASYVDLHDDAWSDSRVWSVYDGWQVGMAAPDDRSHIRVAMLWRGSKASSESLHDLLPTDESVSEARGVWHDGRTLYIVGSAGGHATVWSRPLCLADLDADGELTVFDFLAFQNAFDAGQLAADYDRDGSLTIFDFLAFQNAFDDGCE